MSIVIGSTDVEEHSAAPAALEFDMALQAEQPPDSPIYEELADLFETPADVTLNLAVVLGFEATLSRASNYHEHGIVVMGEALRPTAVSTFRRIAAAGIAPQRGYHPVYSGLYALYSQIPEVGGDDTFLLDLLHATDTLQHIAEEGDAAIPPAFLEDGRPHPERAALDRVYGVLRLGTKRLVTNEVDDQEAFPRHRLLLDIWQPYVDATSRRPWLPRQDLARLGSLTVVSARDHVRRERAARLDAVLGIPGEKRVPTADELVATARAAGTLSLAS